MCAAHMMFSYMEERFTDQELLEHVMEKYGWTQQQLAERLLFDRSQISKVIRGKQRLRPIVRQRAEQLLEGTDDPESA
jgi:transcriptional regulator with XRE-family HTH domain